MVGIARTQPRYHKQTAVHEIEKLYLAAIRSARRVIYIESQ
jgi:phospholipase D1/2